ncbi:unnamed protein product [Nesidiocoris tenuis]|uniref:Uncharacterized protein n=1 Tax=Nesidiocoris tenuis TaxID=355587 RepID=A0A6H5GHR9_9HEMI|nr:unnamed protein product [Nesidiocoris tenuis]
MAAFSWVSQKAAASSGEPTLQDDFAAICSRTSSYSIMMRLRALQPPKSPRARSSVPQQPLISSGVHLLRGNPENSTQVLPYLKCLSNMPIKKTPNQNAEFERHRKDSPERLRRKIKKLSRKVDRMTREDRSRSRRRQRSMSSEFSPPSSSPTPSPGDSSDSGRQKSLLLCSYNFLSVKIVRFVSLPNFLVVCQLCAQLYAMAGATQNLWSVASTWPS